MERDGVANWYFGIPLITRSYLTGIAVVALLCVRSVRHGGRCPLTFWCPAQQLEIVGPLQLYFNYRLVFQRGEVLSLSGQPALTACDAQWWRLVTPFFYFGPINFDFIFHMFFLYAGAALRPSAIPHHLAVS